MIVMEVMAMVCLHVVIASLEGLVVLTVTRLVHWRSLWVAVL